MTALYVASTVLTAAVITTFLFGGPRWLRVGLTIAFGLVLLARGSAENDTYRTALGGFALGGVFAALIARREAP